MKPGLLAAVLIALSACATTAATSAKADPVDTLLFAPEEADDLSRISITFTLEGDTDGETIFDFPERWGPDDNLGALISGRSAADAATGAPLPIATNGPSVTVNHAPGQRIRLSWTVAQDYDGLPQWGVQRMPGMRPVLQPAYASLIGHTFLPSVEGRDPDVSISFDRIPTGAAFSQPAPDGTSAPIPLSTAQDSIYALGAYSFAETPSTGVRVATLGGWALSEPEIAATTSFVIRDASNAFGDVPFSQYFVAVTPLPDLPQGSSVIGTGFTESFFILATRNAEATELTHTIVHEILHEWITRRMGVTDEATDPARMWFTEGFTEYYSQLILLDAGLIPLDGFLDNLNGLWAAYQVSPVNTMPSGDLIDHVWDSRETERLPYQRGALLALSWDTTALTNGRPLADAIAALINRADALRETGETPQLTDAAIEEALADAIGPRFKEDLSVHIRKGELLVPDSLVLPDCLRTEIAEDHMVRLALAPAADPEACRATLLKALMPPV